MVKMALVKFDVTSGDVYADFDTHKYSAYKLGDGRTLFHALAGGNKTLLMLSSAALPLGYGNYRRQVSIFDMQLTIDYAEFLALYFEVIDDADICRFWRVSTWTGAGKTPIGILRFDDGSVFFDGSPVGVSGINALYAKVLMLK